MAEAEQFGGNALNTSQRLAVKNSLAKLSVQENLKAVRFWGKIVGTQKDYLIAMATSATDAIKKSFYFSSDDGLTFSKLPAIDEFVAQKSAAIRRTFTGNMSFVYKPQEAKAPTPTAGDVEDIDGDVEEVEDAGAPKASRLLNELERLSWTVTEIENDTCVVPVGARYLTPTGTIQLNGAFRGLSSSELPKLDSYLLFRDPKNDRTLARIRKGGVSNNSDFLDRIVEDQPKGIWRLLLDDDGQSARLRNLVWPGFEAKFISGQSAHACGYYGTGEKNHDVMFMF